MTNKEESQVSVQMTPNPNTIKFIVDINLLDSGSVDFPDVASAKNSVVATGLFEIEGVAGVFIGTHFISVTKLAAAEWSELAEPVIEKIKVLLAENEDFIDPAYLKNLPSNDIATDRTETEKGIISILDEEIRPAIAMDGGDIRFHSFENGVVTLYLQGACSNCPSSVMTLKMGIENRLREEFPEIKEVVSL